MLVVCAGTGTDVGKTWVGASALAALRGRGVTVAARKPAQSYAPGDGGTATDADVLAGATGEDVRIVCPPHRWYPVPMAPPMAAEVLGQGTFRLADLVAELVWPAPPPAVRWVESAGGVLSPLADDGDTAGLAAMLGPDLVVLVADAGLGTINAVRASLPPLASHPVVVFLNRFDPSSELHTRNRDWLSSRCGVDVVASLEGLCDRLGGNDPPRG